MRRSSKLGLRPLAEIAEAALLCFTQRGYRLTQMSDVGAELGMSPTAAYRYVESKEALKLYYADEVSSATWLRAMCRKLTDEAAVPQAA